MFVSSPVRHPYRGNPLTNQSQYAALRDSVLRRNGWRRARLADGKGFETMTLADWLGLDFAAQ